MTESTVSFYPVYLLQNPSGYKTPKTESIGPDSLSGLSWFVWFPRQFILFFLHIQQQMDLLIAFTYQYFSHSFYTSHPPLLSTALTAKTESVTHSTLCLCISLCSRELLSSLIHSSCICFFFVTGSIYRYCKFVTELRLQSQTGVRMIATEQDSEHSTLGHGETK